MAVYGTFEPLVQRYHTYLKCSNQINCCKYLKFGWYLQLEECSMIRHSERIQIYSQSSLTPLTDNLLTPLTNSLLRVLDLTANKFIVNIYTYSSK